MTNSTRPPRRVAPGLLRAAAAGLLGVVVVGCGEAASEPDWTFPPPVDTTPEPAAESPGPAAESPPAAEGGSPLPEVAAVVIGTDTGDENRYEPQAATAEGGREITIRFENRGTVPHSLVFEEGPDAGTDEVTPGTFEELVFDAPEPGEYAFSCTVQPDMTGSLVVE